MQDSVSISIWLMSGPVDDGVIRIHWIVWLMQRQLLNCAAHGSVFHSVSLCLSAPLDQIQLLVRDTLDFLCVVYSFRAADDS